MPLCLPAGGWGAAPAVHSQRQTLQAQLCPQQLLLPSVPPALKWVSPSQPPGERTASVRAPGSQGAWPQGLSSERARVGAGFRELGALPGPSATVEREGGPLPVRTPLCQQPPHPLGGAGGCPHLLGNAVMAKGQRPCSPAWKLWDSRHPSSPAHLGCHTCEGPWSIRAC